MQRWPLADLGIDSPEELQRLLEAVQWAEIEQSLAHLPRDLPMGPTLERNRALVASRDRSRDRVLQRLLQLGALASLGGLPQLARPGDVDSEHGLPVGLGVLTYAGGDRLLLELPDP
ncbi:MAG: hypothetical protein WCH37_05885 [Synechococcaceae cyanobacterium ELA182]